MYYPSLSKEQFFSRDVFYSGGINLWSQADQVPGWARDLVFNKDVEVHAVDFFTPLEKGKEWLFALTCQHQPCTGSLLMQGGDLFVRAAQDDTGYVSFHLGLEVMGRVVLVCRNFFGYNPSDTDFSINYRPPERFESLPLPLREAYYTRFDGLNIPGSITVGTYTRLLPFPVERPWQSWVRYLEEFAGYQKKYIPWLEERIPNVKPKRKGGAYTNFMMFLDTRPTLSGKEGDVFFVKNHIQDGVIYHVKDADVENMNILVNPTAAIDQYCEHVLLGKAERFDFTPFVDVAFQKGD